jgi:hypothetical protein
VSISPQRLLIEIAPVVARLCKMLSETDYILQWDRGIRMRTRETSHRSGN